MLPAQNNGVGMNIGFPDVCLTPVGPAVVPIPYPNIAMNAMCADPSPNVLLTMMPALNMGAVIPMTLGDSAGVANWTVMGPATFSMGNPTVSINALPAITLTSPSTGNTMNDGLAAALVPSVTNVFFTFALTFARADLELLCRDGRAVGFEHRGDGVGVVRVSVFSADVPARVHTATRELEAQGLDVLVLDLRGNPGGELDACVELAGDFLEAGALVATMVEADGDRVELRARGGAPSKVSLVLLVDGGTASAAEIFAGAMKAHGRALVLGERTYGKGEGRMLTPASDASGRLWESRATFLLPDGTELSGAGVEPHLPL